MKSKLFLLILFFFCFSVVSFAQMLYPIQGTFQKKSAQGMAIWKDKAFVFNDGGHCRVYDLVLGNLVSDFDLSSADNNNHVNAVCFGVEYPKSSRYPYIYVTEYKSPSRCFVERITDNGSELVQVIRLKLNKKDTNVSFWIVDRDNKIIYCLIRDTSKLQSHKQANNTIIAFKLPLISSGKEIVFTEKEILFKYNVSFPNGVQDAVIKNGRMYIATGLQQSSNEKPNSARAVKIIDLRYRKLIKSIDLTLVTTNEPEGIDFYGKNLLLFCGQEGGIYKIKY